MLLTQENVRALRYTRDDGQPQFTWDKRMVGLGVRITASGVKAFVLRYRVLGRQRQKTLGRTERHTVEQARTWARKGLSDAETTTGTFRLTRSASAPQVPWQHCGGATST